MGVPQGGGCSRLSFDSACGRHQPSRPRPLKEEAAPSGSTPAVALVLAASGRSHLLDKDGDGRRPRPESRRPGYQ